MKPSQLIPRKTPPSNCLKSILMLTGPSGCGKSSILKALGEHLRQSAIFAYVQKGQSRSHDQRMVFKFKGKIVGIGTAGDTTQIADDNRDFFRAQGCSISVLAANTDAGVDVHVKSTSKIPAKNIVAIKKRDVSSQLAREVLCEVYAEAFERILSVKGIKAIVARARMEASGF